MNENKLFDDIARTLASPIPRRQAFGHILRGIAGAALVSVFGSGTARAIVIKCPMGQFACGKVCCKNGWICYSATSLCCPTGQPACGTVCCPNGWICCNSATSLCCNRGQTCDGKKCKTKPSESSFLSTGM